MTRRLQCLEYVSMEDWSAAALLRAIEDYIKSRDISARAFSKEAEVPYSWVNDLKREKPPAKLNSIYLRRVLEIITPNFAAKNYSLDEDLMKKCASQMQKAIKLSNKNVDIEDANYCIIELYKLIREYRNKGEEVEPNLILAALILKNIM